MGKAGDANIKARKAALDILNRLESSRDLLDTVMGAASADRLQELSLADRRLVNAIVYGVIRWRRLIDWIIVKHAASPEQKIAPRVQNILRIGIFQILFLDRVPDFAAVNTSVEMAKRSVSLRASRFVNGLLRGLLRRRPLDMEALLPREPVRALAISQSFPDWLVLRWVRRFGMDEALALCEALNRIPPLTVRTNTLKTDRQRLQEVLASACEKVYPSQFAPEGLCFYGPDRPVAQLPAFADGWFQVQDEAAQLVSHLLFPQPGESVLDACAGMGGKTGHIAQLMAGSGKIYAVDRDAEKLQKLDAEMQRLGVGNTENLCLDLQAPDWRHLPEGFDRILLDAPCSATGVIRRNPDIKWAAGKKALKRFAGRQLACLNWLAPRLAPRGVMVYAVCSMEPEETDEVVENFLQKHPDFAMVTDVCGIPESAAELVDEKGFLRSFAHLHNTDGFFAARLRRK
ncbi:MAG: 16S rRNA (cytosine(967)-C(5))-methyltransferase RsmB [Desulfosalsimonadaceae bacterium]